MAQSLPQRALGKSGINVSAIGLGCMSFSGVYGPSEDAAATALIHEALDAGITMLNSSDAYGKGQNETLLGNAIKGRAQERRARHQVRQSRRRRRQIRRRPAGVRHELVRGEPEAARRRRDRPLLRAPHRSGRADRGHRRRDGQARAAGQGARAGPERSLAQDHRPRPQGASDRRGAERILAALSRAGRRHPQDHARPRHLVRGLCAARARPAHLRHRRSGDLERGRHPQAPAALRRRQPRAQPRAGAEGRGDRQAQGLHAGAARARLGAGAGHGRHPDSRHQAEEAVAGEHRRAQRQAFGQPSLRRSPAPCRPAPSRARAIRKRRWRACIFSRIKKYAARGRGQFCVAARFSG